MKRKYILSFGLLFFIIFRSAAQDPHFSQYFASPLTLNPALTGKFDGLVRVSANYRNQWPSIFNAFQTGTVSADFQLLHQKLPVNDQLGVGIMGMYDVNGNGILKSNFVSGSVAYHKGLDEEGYHQLGVGMSATYAQRNLNPGKLLFEDQLTSIGFTGNTSELLSFSQSLNLDYISVNAGIVYSGSTSEYNQFYAGASVYHVNQPDKSFLDNTFKTKERYTLHAGGYFFVAEGTTLFLSGNYQRQNAAQEMILGAAAGWMLNQDDRNPTNLFAGSWFRLGDAVIPFVGLDINRFRVGISYDVNISGLSQASRRQGGFEFSLIYVQPYTDRSRKVLRCPSNF